MKKNIAMEKKERNKERRTEQKRRVEGGDGGDNVIFLNIL
jgi:hypothetical protein